MEPEDIVELTVEVDQDCSIFEFIVPADAHHEDIANWFMDSVIPWLEDSWPRVRTLYSHVIEESDPEIEEPVCIMGD